jgi:hypothetical protein
MKNVIKELWGAEPDQGSTIDALGRPQGIGPGGFCERISMALQLRAMASMAQITGSIIEGGIGDSKKGSHAR